MFEEISGETIAAAIDRARARVDVDMSTDGKHGDVVPPGDVDEWTHVRLPDGRVDWSAQLVQIAALVASLPHRYSDLAPASHTDRHFIEHGHRFTYGCCATCPFEPLAEAA